MAEPKASKPSIRMTDNEAWEFLRGSINGTLTTLRRDGRPVALPVWFVVLDERIYISTRGKKLTRLRKDARCSFLVEAGQRWAELRAVHLECDGVVLDAVPPGLGGRISAAMAEKYAPYRTARAEMPKATRAAYELAAGGIIELRPVGKMLTWDNRKLDVP